MNKLTIQTNFPLKAHNTFAIDAHAKYAVIIHNTQDIQALLKTHEWQQSKIAVLGQGSNTLFVSDFDGLVLINAIKGIAVNPLTNNQIMLEVGAGEDWHQLVLFAVKNNYYGIENLSLIPGTVGAAPIQNIGAYGAELKDVFHSLDAIDLHTGEVKTFDSEACQFGYRDSVFKNAFKDRYIITTVRLVLSKTPHLNVSYHSLNEKIKSMQLNDLTIKNVSDAVIAVRQSKLPDPKKIPNAGSFFKNPVIDYDQYLLLKKQYADIPNFSSGEEHVKIPAAWLIEQCGWKGKRVGNVGVHSEQALVLVNHGHAKGEEILALSDNIAADVYQKFNIALSREVSLI